MLLRRSWARLQGSVQSRAGSLFFKRPLAITSQQPIISFTFDDFPRSALFTGGAILNRYHLAGTYYVSLGLLDKEAPTGRIASPEDLPTLVEQGHELGCHTFSHCDSWKTDTKTFENSIIENRVALSRLLPGAEFKTFSYPISPPRPLTKARMPTYFRCCRAGGQVPNIGTVDLNQLSAYFLEKTRHDIEAVRNLIDRNRQARGWLILATHDISDEPTAFGCTPGFFQDVVQYAVSSGARILPVVSALGVLQALARTN